MSRKVTALSGISSLPLPNGLTISANDTVVVTDAVWRQILDQDRIAADVRDLGATTDPLTPVPTYRDMQHASSQVEVVTIPHLSTVPPAGTPLGAVVLRYTS